MTAKNVKLWLGVAILIGLLVSGLVLVLAQDQGNSQVIAEPENGHQDAFGIRAAIPVTYQTGLWPTVPIAPVAIFTDTVMSLMDEPRVTMIGDWQAQIEFTTTVPIPAARIYYGVYEPGPLLPQPRYLSSVKETLPESITSTQYHSVTIDFSGWVEPDSLQDINDMASKGGGLVAYRIAVYQTAQVSFLYDRSASVRFYDRRFEFYNGQMVPTVIEGPFVDQITENSAIISWDTDLPANGVVQVQGEEDFPASNSNDTHFEVPLTELTAGATYTYSVQTTDGVSTTTTRQYFFRTPAQDTTQFTFALMGDSRAGYGGGERDYNGVNAYVLKSLTSNAFKRGVDFIVHTGDLFNGYTVDAVDFEMQFDAYKDAVESVGHYIPIYEAIGNHELLMDAYIVSPYAKPAMFDKEGDTSSEVLFANEFVNPTNGPTPDNVAANTPPGKSLPPYEETVYYFDYGNSRFVVMNNHYWYSTYAEQYGGNLEGYVLDDQTAWLIEEFSQAKADDSIEHVFFFAHEPPFPNSGHYQDAMWYSGGAPADNVGWDGTEWDRTYVVERRDEIWEAFVGTGKATVGSFSHEHDYSRTYISTSLAISGTFSHPAWQIISGGAGAPGDTQKMGLPWSNGVEKFSTELHYTLLRVDGKEVRIEVYDINDQIIESVILKTDGGTVVLPDAPQVEPVESTPAFVSNATGQIASPSPAWDIQADLLDIPAGYKTGQWPTYPITAPMSITNATMFLMDEPQVTMIGDWKAQIAFTTTVPVPATRVYYGVYEPGLLLSRPRYLSSAKEDLEGYSTQHVVELDFSGWVDPDNLQDINNMAAKGGGLVAYRIEVYQTAQVSFLYDRSASVRFYDRRFEFYNGQMVPTVIEGPFVDQITENSAIISWDTDLPADGVVRVLGVGDFAASNSNDIHFEVPLTGLTAGATYTYSVQTTDGVSTTTTRQYFFRTPAQDTTQFTFALMGDSRAGYGGGERDYDGVNARALDSLARDAFKQGIDFIVHTGDLFNGYTVDAVDFEMQFDAYKDAIESVGRYIPIYEAIGNHELLMDAYMPSFYAKPAMFDKEGNESSEVLFANEFVNPTNGPTPDNVAANTPPGKSLPPYEENVYYFDYGNSRFVVMNNHYWYSTYAEQYGGNLEGYVLDDQTAWLTEVFSQTKADDSIEHVFFFAHEPPFPNSGHYQDAMWYSGGAPADNVGWDGAEWDRTYVVERRDEIWEAFVGTGKATVGSFSHEHDYSRTYITTSLAISGTFSHPAWQIISGGAGAPGDTQKMGLPWSDGVEKFSTELHYTLLRVDGKKVMLEVYNIGGELIDSAELTLTQDPVGINYDIYLPVILKNQ